MVYKAHHDTIAYLTIQDKQIPSEFNDFRIFFISDIHRRRINWQTLQTINEQIDIVLIGGDLTEKGVPLSRVQTNIRKLKEWNAPIFFVWGNNDYEANWQKLKQILVDEEITTLENTSVEINRNDQSISIMGFNCNKYREANYKLTTQNAQGDFRILVTHAPSAYYNLARDEQSEIQFVLAGHTHGGQIRIFGFGMYKSGGLTKHNRTYILISEGYGYSTLPFRLGTKAECHVITLSNVEK